MSTQDVKLPDIGEGVTEGELVKWLVQVGDSVEADQPVAEVMTDKATVEVPTPYAGKVKELKAQEGDTIPIETVMLILEGGGNEKGTAAAATDTAAAAPTTTPAPRTRESEVGFASSSGAELYPPPAEIRVLATPATRRLAREMNVDINQLSGTGLAGRVTREDIFKSSTGAGAVSAGRPTLSVPQFAYQSGRAQEEERVPLKGVRKKIAENLQMAKQIVPHFTLMEEAIVTELFAMRAQAKKTGEAYGVKVTFLPFVIKALVATMREFPMFNASIDDHAGEIVYKKYFNIGFAADTPNGLLVPVIKNADSKTILQLSQEIELLAKKARDGKLALEEMKGATITITNIGSVGGTYATPIINHPEVAILGMYKITDKPVFKDGEFYPEKVMNYTVTCDHRLIDGAVAARFMQAFVGRIQEPSRLMLDMM